MKDKEKAPDWVKRYPEFEESHRVQCAFCECTDLSDEWNFCTSCGKPIPHPQKSEVG